MPIESTTGSARTEQLRNLLEATANTSAFPSSRFTRSRVITAIVAFVLAGAATGGAVSAVATSGGQQTDPIIASRYVAEGVIGQHGFLLGSPTRYFGVDNVELDLGTAPTGSTSLVVVLNCVDPGSVTAVIDAQSGSPVSVSAGACDGATGQEISIVRPGRHTMTLSPHKRQRVAIFASWVKEPPMPDASSAQQAVLEDGKVTRAEYLASYNRYAGCMTASGYALPSAPDSAIYFPTTTSDEAQTSGAFDRCYASEFKQVDPLWQVYAHDAIEACLADRGLRPSSPSLVLFDLIADLAPIHLTFDQCSSEHPPPTIDPN